MPMIAPPKRMSSKSAVDEPVKGFNSSASVSGGSTSAGTSPTDSVSQALDGVIIEEAFMIVARDQPIDVDHL